MSDTRKDVLNRRRRDILLNYPNRIIVANAILSEDKELLKHSFSTQDINSSHFSYDGWTALMYACHKNKPVAVSTLLELGADPNAGKSNYYWRALSLSCWEGGSHCVRLLLEAGAIKDERTKCGWTELMIACYRGHIQTLRELHKHGANLHLFDAHGFTPLLFAAQQGENQILSFLLTEVDGICADGVDTCNWTPLMISVHRNHIESARTLCRAGADVCKSKACGVTALHIAAASGDVSIVELLINLGASLFAKTCNGKTVVDFAQSRDMVKYLTQVVLQQDSCSRCG